MWQSKYEVDDLNEIVMTLWEQVKPLYQQLHAYTRRKLIMHYGEERFPETGHIPAHILGTRVRFLKSIVSFGITTTHPKTDSPK